MIILLLSEATWISICAAIWGLIVGGVMWALAPRIKEITFTTISKILGLLGGGAGLFLFATKTKTGFKTTARDWALYLFFLFVALFIGWGNSMLKQDTNKQIPPDDNV